VQCSTAELLAIIALPLTLMRAGYRKVQVTGTVGLTTRF
jgi:hypothetical protein